MPELRHRPLAPKQWPEWPLCRDQLSEAAQCRSTRRNVEGDSMATQQTPIGSGFGPATKLRATGRMKCVREPRSGPKKRQRKRSQTRRCAPRDYDCSSTYICDRSESCRPALKPAFEAGGTITAGNASPVTGKCSRACRTREPRGAACSRRAPECWLAPLAGSHGPRVPTVAAGPYQPPREQWRRR